MKTLALLALVVSLLVLVGNTMSLASELQDTADYMSKMSAVRVKSIESQCTKITTGTTDVACRDKILAQNGLSYMKWFIHLQTYAVNIDSFNRKTTPQGNVIYSVK